MNNIKDRLSVYIQLFLWVIGISKHNKLRDECTPDFSCCCKGKSSFFKRLSYAVCFPIRSYQFKKYCNKE